jgi:DnaA-homolog protein
MAGDSQFHTSLPGQQLPLTLSKRSAPTLERYIAGANQEAVAAIVAGEQQIVVWGSHGVGKSHLLQAAVARQPAGTALYLPCGNETPIAMLDEINSIPLLAIDDIDQWIGNRENEERLFALYNRQRDGGGRILVSSTQPLAGLTWQLADLFSRLCWGGIYHLVSMAEEDLRQLLQQLAAWRGMVIGDEVARYLLDRVPRSPMYLCQLVENLDRASLVEQRRLTIPFVREWLAGSSDIKKKVNLST